jgi:peptidoglycan/LPS O-acetylase OafA/YrhL
MPGSCDRPRRFLQAWFNAGCAVIFFYVISGFLITYTLQRNYKLDLPVFRLEAPAG